MWTGDFAAFVEGYGGRQYHSVWEHYWDTGEDQELVGFAVVGTETSPDYLEGQASASYLGRAFAMFLPQDTEGSDDEFKIWGELELDADFAAGEVSGFIDELEIEVNDGDREGLGGSIDLQSGTIAGNQFSGTLASDDTREDFEGTYGGTYFGPRADEVGGVISATGPEVVGTGFFSGERE